MELNKCLGCMEDFQGYPCPKCGFDPQQIRGNEYALPPQTILAGKYLVGRVLGQGGFGITYIGWDIALERKVAIKEYYPNGQANRTPGTRVLTWYTSDNALQARQAGMEMFLKEARKMARVDDIPGVVRVRDLFRENDTAYIVMDFVEGETLKARLKRTGPMSWDQAKDIFRPAIRAMEQVHKAGLIHRDLSPDNLMLTPEGKVKILDLGAAKDLNINTGASSMQVAKGGFSPFEQYTQRGGSGPWTDVYAMAATIYYTLTGKIPPAAIDRIEEDTISWDLPRIDTLPSNALEALKQAMTVSAKKRTQTMGELQDGLSEKSDSWGIPQLDTLPPEVLEILKRSMATSVQQQPQTAAEPESNTIVAVRDCRDSSSQVAAIQKDQQSVPLAAGGYHTVALRENGTVVAVGDNSNGQCAVSVWTDIVAVAAGFQFTVGLRKDGTVMAAGNKSDGQCAVNDWSNIVAIATGGYHTVGLQKNGTVVATAYNKDGQSDVTRWSSWSGIVAVAAGFRHTVGLRRDGTVVAVGYDVDGQCAVGGWNDIVAVAAGEYHTVGLRKDGTVVATGDNKDGQCDVARWSNWSDIVAIAAGFRHTVGLRKDGTVVAVGNESDGRCAVGSWRDIVAIAAGRNHTVGLRRDGTVVATGDDFFGQCDVSDWRNIQQP